MKTLVLFAGIGQGLYCLVLFLTALFLILLILIQRGRGGGLSGAFGGMGGQSAFGSKAGDTFTKITIAAATFWLVLCLAGVKFLGSGGSVFDGAGSVMGAPLDPDSPDLDLEANVAMPDGSDASNSDSGASAEGVKTDAGPAMAPATTEAAPGDAADGSDEVE
jgi:preprotein translocase subunit SecG